jgi:hypothetical protein
MKNRNSLESYKPRRSKIRLESLGDSGQHFSLEASLGSPLDALYA